MMQLVIALALCILSSIGGINSQQAQGKQRVTTSLFGTHVDL